MIDFGMNGRVVVITGGASGIGLAAAKMLARDGAKIAILDVRQDAIDQALEQLRQIGGEPLGLQMDISVCSELAAAAIRISAELGPVFGLVACAGTSVAAKAEDLTVDEWNRVLAVNGLGTFLSCQTFGREMVGRGEGAIVVIGSIDGLGGQPGRTAYAASKFAVNGIVKSLALEWGRHNVRVNCIAPTFVDTPMIRANIPPAFFDTVVDRTPMGRIASADDIAAPTLFLLSDASAFINGVVLPVDGALTSGFVTRASGADLSSRRLLESGIYTE